MPDDYNCEYPLTPEDLHKGYLLILGAKFPLKGYRMGDSVRIRMSDSPTNAMNRQMRRHTMGDLRDMYMQHPGFPPNYGLDLAGEGSDRTVRGTVTGRLNVKGPEEQRLPPKPAPKEPDYSAGLGSKLAGGLLSSTGSLTKKE
jgi:hypothetical protein